jgi:hypothetical protein
VVANRCYDCGCEAYVVKAIAAVMAAVTIVNIPGPIMGSFDVACWLWRLPGCCYKAASGCCDCGSERKLLCDMAVMTAVLL